MGVSVNKVILIGRLGKDPEVRSAQSGKTVCRFTLATDSGFGANVKTDWHNLVCFDKQADFCKNYLRKGALIYAEGRVSYGSYEKDGQKRYTTDIIVSTVQSLQSRNEGGGAAGNFDPNMYSGPSYGGGSENYGGGYAGNAPAAEAPSSNTDGGGNFGGDDFDNLPF